jgi:hypothetical protein
MAQQKGRLRFQLRQVELGYNVDGDLITSCIASKRPIMGRVRLRSDVTFPRNSPLHCNS